MVEKVQIGDEYPKINIGSKFKIKKISQNNDIYNATILSFPTDHNLAKNKLKISNGERAHRGLHTRDGRPVPHASDPFTPEAAEAVAKYFLNSDQKYKYRNFALFMLGIGNGKRCGDMLALRVDDVYDDKTDSIKKLIRIREGKTQKLSDVRLNDKAREAILYYIHNSKLKMDDYLFKSRQKNQYGEYVISTKTYWRILNDVAEDLNLDMEHVGTHGMRKLVGRTIYNSYPNKEDGIIAAQMYFKHESPKTTTAYVGIAQDKIQVFIAGISHFDIKLP
jgi:integrase